MVAATAATATTATTIVVITTATAGARLKVRWNFNLYSHNDGDDIHNGGGCYYRGRCNRNDWG